MSDVSLDELHAFAAAQGIHSGFHGDHYDVPEEYHRADGGRRQRG